MADMGIFVNDPSGGEVQTFVLAFVGVGNQIHAILPPAPNSDELRSVPLTGLRFAGVRYNINEPWYSPMIGRDEHPH